MPNRNGKGPQGNGSQTGRRLGNCNSNRNSEATSEVMAQGTGCRMRRRRGKGFGSRLNQSNKCM